jgi:CheY-like chemotaxis protein
MKVRLIHGSAAEAKTRAAELRSAGFEVDAVPFTSQQARRMVAHLPDAIVIDLSRAPSHGREVALFIRQMKATRRIPLTFVDGDPVKVAAIRRILPDVTYTLWPKIVGALRAAVRRRPKDPVVPGVFAAYAGVPLIKKVGIKPNSVVALVGAPPGFERHLGQVPGRVTVHRNPFSHRTLTLWFVRSSGELERQMRAMHRYAKSAGLWILWPKRTAMPRTDISQVVVRKSGLAAGIVDFKICSVDETWSGLRFTQRTAQARRDRNGI